MKNTTETITKPYATIKLGIDAHAKWYYVAGAFGYYLHRMFAAILPCPT